MCCEFHLGRPSGPIRKLHVPNSAGNDIHIIVRGNQITHIINGHIMAMLIDDDPTHFRADGVIGLQASGNGPQKISFRGIWLKEYKDAAH